MKFHYKSINAVEGIITNEQGHEYFGRITNCGRALSVYTRDTNDLITTIPIEDYTVEKPHGGSPCERKIPGPYTLDIASVSLRQIA